jgi:NADH dehydrogenase [ubiquinone] 1 alpha subcomplex assembly factor 7
MILLCNELIDALPIRQFLKTADGWRERLVDLDPEAGADGAPSFRFIAAPGPSPALNLIDEAVLAAPEDSVAELRPAGLRLAHDIAQRLQTQGGAGLIIDYGYADSRPGDTLQGVADHDCHDVLARPGQADVTALVDFAMLAKSARQAGAQTAGPLEQGSFLRALGIAARAEALKSNLGPAPAAEIDAALERLTGPDAMGNLFKVLLISPAGAPAAAGFEDAS